MVNIMIGYTRSCFKFNVCGVEVSVACGAIGDSIDKYYKTFHNRCEIALFEDNKDVTEKYTGTHFIYYANDDDLLMVIDKIRKIKGGE